MLRQRHLPVPGHGQMIHRFLAFPRGFAGGLPQIAVDGATNGLDAAETGLFRPSRCDACLTTVDRRRGFGSAGTQSNLTFDGIRQKSEKLLAIKKVRAVTLIQSKRKPLYEWREPPGEETA